LDFLPAWADHNYFPDNLAPLAPFRPEATSRFFAASSVWFFPSFSILANLGKSFGGMAGHAVHAYQLPVLRFDESGGWVLFKLFSLNRWESNNGKDEA
jgi:hypothetical protein